MGWVMRSIIGPLAGYRRRANENLARIWPELPVVRRNEIAKGALDNTGRSLIENYSAAEFQVRAAGFKIIGPGLEALEHAAQEQRPVILVSGHFGNYEAARAALVARGFVIGGLYRPMRNPYFNTHYIRTMQAFGGPVFPQGRGGTTGFVRHLRAGGLLVLLFDQRSTGKRIDFLGQPAETALSASELALRYDAHLIPFYATRQSDGLSFEITLDAPIAHSNALEMTTTLTRSLEARIIAHPNQWFWVHRRWK